MYLLDGLGVETGVDLEALLDCAAWISEVDVYKRQYVIRAIGERQAYRYFLTAERIDAVRARDLGLAHEVVAPERLDARIASLAQELLRGGPEALAASKDLIRAVAHRPIDDAVVEETARRIAAQRATPQAKEGLAAFLDKRPPAWSAGGF